MDLSILLANAPILEKICQNLTVSEANNLRESLGVPVLECPVPVTDRDQIISELSQIDRYSSRIAHLLQTKGSHKTLDSEIEKGNYEIVKRLIAAGAIVKPVEFYPGNLLFEAIKNRNVQILELLLQTDLRQHINDIWSDGTPLFYAVQAESPEMVDLLIQNGAEVDKVPSNSFYTPLFEAISLKNVELVQKLLDAGADPMKNSIDTGLTMAMRNHDYEMIKLFVQRGLDINAVAIAGSPPLEIAISHSEPKLVEFLLQLGANVDQRGYQDKTMLQLALKQLISKRDHKNKTIVNLLLEYGANPNDAQTPLEKQALNMAHQAAYPGSQPIHPGVQPPQSVYPWTQSGYPGAYPGAQPVYPWTQPGYPGAQPPQPGAQPGYPGAQPPQPGTQSFFQRYFPRNWF